MFSTLIGGAGCYALTPPGRYTWGGYYSPRSLIWNSRWVTTDGIIESREAFALPADPHVVTILRRIRALDGPARIRAVLDVRAGFGAEAMRDTHRDERRHLDGPLRSHLVPLDGRRRSPSRRSRPSDGRARAPTRASRSTWFSS